MAPSQVILLACGSFNPPTNMHLRMFEIARDHLHRMGQHYVVGGLISPVHDAYGKNELESSTHRIQMVKLALQDNDWIRLSDWECKQECWSRTRQVLQYHQNSLNAFRQNNVDDFNESRDQVLNWIPENVKNTKDPVCVKLLCGADLLESFGTPGLWKDEDIESIVGNHGLVVITRSNTFPQEFIYNSDLLTKYMNNIIIVTEWIRNEVSSTKIRRALRRSESVKYLLPDKVVEYIYKHSLYGAELNKYLHVPTSQFPISLTPCSPCDIPMDSPPNNSLSNCMHICNNNLFQTNHDSNKRISIDTPDSVKKMLPQQLRHPGQAVKVVVQKQSEKMMKKEVRKLNEDTATSKRQSKTLKASKSLTRFDAFDADLATAKTKSSSNLKECKSCDENLIKFIFTKHGIQVISDVETIV